MFIRSRGCLITFKSSDLRQSSDSCRKLPHALIPRPLQNWKRFRDRRASAIAKVKLNGKIINSQTHNTSHYGFWVSFPIGRLSFHHGDHVMPLWHIWYWPASEMRQNSLSPSGMTLYPSANGGSLTDILLLLSSCYGPAITLCWLDPAPRILNHKQSSNAAPQYLCILHTRKEKKKKRKREKGRKQNKMSNCRKGNC